MAARQVFFATNRLFDAAAKSFGGVCCDPPDQLLSGFATCEAVADPVPEGRLDKDSLMVAADPAGGLADTIGKWLATAAETGATPLLFTHGFNHAFAEALTRTAKLCAWLEAGGAPALLPLAFTWPSGGAGSLGGYGEDGKQVGRSGPALAKLIAMVGAQRKPTQRIHYMAHSMGVRATRYGMQAIGPLLGGMRPPVFRQAFLMAGDDEADVLDPPGAGVAGALLPIAKVAEHVTIGVNRDDGVVWFISGEVVNRNTRLGAAGARHPESLPGNLKVVDYSRVVLASGPDILVPQTEATANWVGHQYYRNAPKVRDDLVAALKADGPPEHVPGRRWGVPGNAAITEDPSRLYPAE